jgi:ribosomal-protein-alanine N-acetyltransferase
LYRDEDFPAVSELEIAGIHEPYRPAVFVRQMAVLSPATFLAAVSGSTVVGFAVASVVQDDPTSAWILRMLVRAGFRHQGIGTALLRAMVKTLEKQSIGCIRLTVAPSNTPAIRLCTGEGFVQEGIRPAYFGSGEDRVVMRRDTSPVFYKS